MIRNADSLYPNNINIKNSSCYRKYNRCKKPNINIGDNIIDVNLLNCNMKYIKLSKLLKINKDKPTLIVSGSIT